MSALNSKITVPGALSAAALIDIGTTFQNPLAMQNSRTILGLTNIGGNTLDKSNYHTEGATHSANNQARPSEQKMTMVHSLPTPAPDNAFQG